MTDFVNNLKSALLSGFINEEIEAYESLKPKILINDKSKEKKVLGSIIDNLLDCEEFSFAVAFLTSGGVASLHTTFKLLEEKNIKGNIIISDYLNFSNPEGMRKIIKFKNIRTYFLRDKDFHGKSFLFKNKKKHTVIIGSSNLTENGLSKNLEINIQVTGNKNSKIVNDIIDLHNNCKKFSVKLNDKIIKDYEKLYKEFNFKNLIKSKDEFVVSDSISQPNSMQVEAIENLEELRLSKKIKPL